MERYQTGTTTSGQSETGSNGNKSVLHTPQSWRCSLVSYQDIFLDENLSVIKLYLYFH